MLQHATAHCRNRCANGRYACRMGDDLEKPGQVEGDHHGQKKCRVRESPGIQDKDGQHCKTLLNHPGIATIEHLLQITWARALYGQRFLLFQNGIIRGPLYGA